MSLEEILQQKTNELLNLQLQYDEFVESSKEIELELENEIKDNEIKFNELNKKISIYEDKINQLNEKNNTLTNDYNKISNELIKIKNQLNNIIESNRVLESKNDELIDKNRILEQSEEDLKYKLQSIEEELYFTQQDLIELKQSKLVIESRLKQELTDLQSELSKYDNITTNEQSIENTTTSNNKNDNNNQSDSLLNDYSQLKEQYNEIQLQLSDNETNLIELGEELEHTQEELLNKANVIDELKSQLLQECNKYNNELINLQKQLNDKDIEINRLLLSIDNLKQQDTINNQMIQTLEHTIETNSNNYNNNKDNYIKQIEKLNNDIIQFKNSIISASEISLPNDTIKRRNSLPMKRQSISSPTNISPDKKISSSRSSSTKRSNDKLLSSPSNDINDIIIDKEINNYNSEITFLESNVSMIRKDIKSAILTKDIEIIRSELIKQLKRYEDLRKANAKLLQNVLLMKGNIQVCCRTRSPIDQDGDSKLCIDVVDNTELVCYDRRSEQWKSFTFDTVWSPESTQADVFADIEPLVLSVVDGYNACIFAYGQTGSGKTYTMNGYGKEYGVSYRTLHKIFELLELRKSKAIELQKEKESKSFNSSYKSTSHNSETNDEVDNDDEGDGLFWYSVEVSMMEIYNEQVNDLLSDTAINKSNINGTSTPILGTNLDIRQSVDNTIYVAGLKQIAVNSLQDVMEVFAKGSANRATTSTNLNERSSRSHLILSVTVTTKTGDSPGVKAKLNLVDLAGSERVGKSGVTGIAMKEAQHINKSLSSLGDVLEALDQKSKHIPYRNSKLTFLLQDSLSGNSRTMMIVTICPTENHSDETLFTLQFATRVRNINIGQIKKNTITKNLEDYIKILKNEIKELKKQKLSYDNNINQVKLENKKLSDKLTNTTDNKIKSIDEMKKSYDMTNAIINQKYLDISNKYNEEKESKFKLTSEVDTLTKSNKKLSDQNKEISREKDRLLNIIKSKELDIEILKNQLQQQTNVNASSTSMISKPPYTSRLSYNPVRKTPSKDIAFGVSSIHTDSDNKESHIDSGLDLSDDIAVNSNRLSIDEINTSMDEKTNKSNNKTNLRLPKPTKRVPSLTNLVAVSSTSNSNIPNNRNSESFSFPTSTRSARPNSVERSGSKSNYLLKTNVINMKTTRSSSIDLVSDPGYNNTVRKPIDSTVTNIPKPAIANRSKEALLKHQERMEKIREQKALIEARNKTDSSASFH